MTRCLEIIRTVFMQNLSPSRNTLKKRLIAELVYLENVDPNTPEVLMHHGMNLKVENLKRIHFHP